MKERKLRIAEFIESIEVSEQATTLLFGGATKSSDEVMSRTNGSCTNGDQYCKGSTNNNRCDNATGVCGDTKNYGVCDNTWQPNPNTPATCSMNVTENCRK